MTLALYIIYIILVNYKNLPNPPRGYGFLAGTSRVTRTRTRPTCTRPTWTRPTCTRLPARVRKPVTNTSHTLLQIGHLELRP